MPGGQHGARSATRGWRGARGPDSIEGSAAFEGATLRRVGPAILPLIALETSVEGGWFRIEPTISTVKGDRRTRHNQHQAAPPSTSRGSRQIKTARGTDSVRLGPSRARHHARHPEAYCRSRR
jgi:hypothetical protein